MTIIADHGGGMATGMADAVRGIVDAVASKPTDEEQRSSATRVLRPTRYGGLAPTDQEFVSLVCQVAALDASLGWLAAVCNAAAYDVAVLPQDIADTIWGSNPNALVTNGFPGDGELFGGRRLTGRWGSVVGAEYADWLLLPANGGTSRALVPRRAVRLDPVDGPAGLTAAGIRDVTVSDFTVDERHILRRSDDRAAVIASAGMAAAVVGSADGVWRKHVDHVRARLATSHGGEQVSDAAAAQVARAASDIDAAKVQINESCTLPRVTDSFQQAVARARDAADRLLGSSRHALDASGPVAVQWADVHAGCRLAVRLRVFP